MGNNETYSKHNLRFIWTIFTAYPHFVYHPTHYYLSMKHFTISELTRSATATRLGIKNDPPAAVVMNLRYLVEAVLDPLREAYGKPIYVNCGYRCPELNKAVGGSRTSQHLTGLAADIHVKGESNAVLYELVKKYRLPYDQLILEMGTVRNPRWVHLSVSRTKNRGEVLYFDGKRYTKLN